MLQGGHLMLKNERAAVLPATGQDKFNYLARYTASDHQIRMIIELDSHLDHAVFLRALRKLYDLVPILNYHFIEEEKAAWFQAGNTFKDEEVAPLFIGSAASADFAHYVMEEIDSKQGPFFKAGIFREASDTLCLKIDHTCSDVGGLKACAGLLAEIYTNLHSGQPCPLQNEFGQRQAAGFLQALGVTDPGAEWAKAAPPAVPAWEFPYRGNQNQDPRFVLRHLSAAWVKSLKVKCQAHGVTVNDVLLAAFFRGLNQTAAIREAEGAIRVTVDLRRFIPQGEDICAANASGGFLVNLDLDQAEAFPQTLSHLLAEIRKKSVAEATLPIAALFELVGMMDFAQVKGMFMGLRQQALGTNRTTPHLSNGGKLAPLIFGDKTAAKEYLIGPAMFAPEFMLMASGYQDTITLAVSFYQSDLPEDFVARLLDQIIQELDQWTRSS